MVYLTLPARGSSWLNQVTLSVCVRAGRVGCKTPSGHLNQGGNQEIRRDFSDLLGV